MTTLSIKLRASLAILLILLVNASQQCSDGCLICDKENKCHLCDIFLRYKMGNQKCEIVTDQVKCLQINTLGNCVQCENNYYIDGATFKCVAVTQDKLIENCLSYLSDQSCAYCVEGMITQDGNCVVTETPIDNCLYQLDKDFCIQCKEDFIIEPDQRRCREIETLITNCSGYSFIECLECKEGYSYNKNKYLLDLKERVNTNNFDGFNVLEGIINEKFNDINWGVYSVCEKMNVENCSLFESHSECKSCSAGYYLTEAKQCEIYPLPKIENCKEYFSLTACKACIDGYFVGPDDDCVPITEIENCSLYSTTAKATECVQCLDEYFLVHIKSCAKRANDEIKECAKYNITSDKCDECFSDLVLTGDGLKCLPPLDNCIDYKLSSQSDESLKCIRCADGYYEDQEQCLQGTVDFCKTYEISTNECFYCQDGYYLEEPRKCTKHKSTTECAEYSKTEADVCLKCTNKFLGFKVSNKCALADTQAGCLSYSSKTVCDKCDVGYLKDGNDCNPLPNEMNCLIAESLSVCTKCKPNYILTGGICKLAPDFITRDCATTNLANGTTSFVDAKCEMCHEDKVSWNFIDYFVCYEDDWISQITNNNIDHCDQISIAGNTQSCIRCSSGYYLNDGSCVESCPVGKYIVTNTITKDGDNYFVTGGPECKDDTFIEDVDNCEIYTYGNSANSIENKDLVCVRCKPGFAKVIKTSRMNSTGMIDKPSLEEFTWEFESPVAFFPEIFGCIDVSPTTAEVILGVKPGEKKIEGCDYYEAVETSYACKKCQTGKRGLIKRVGDADYIESCETTFCNPTITIGLSVTLNSYFSCYKCTDSNSIPFLFIAGSASYFDINGFKAYDLNADGNDFDSVTDGGYSVNCHKKSGTEFNISGYTLPNNCSMAIFNVETTSANASHATSTSLVSTAKLALFCAACEGGYRPKQMKKLNNSVIPHAVYECELIENCASTAWFNYCSECNNNFAYRYHTATGIDHATCISFEKDANCYAAEDGENGKCFICKKGYQKNRDDVCELIEPPNCLEGQSQIKFPIINMNFGILFYLNPQGQGCLKCKNEFTAVRVDANLGLCINSTYLKVADEKSETSYVKNCTGYFLDGATFMCGQCGKGFVVAKNHSQCYPSDKLPDCVVATDDENCEECREFYIPVKHKCQKEDIKNCILYNKNPIQENATCTKCDSGYYLESNNCLQGNVDNCINFSANGTKCNLCADGYQKINANNQDYCFLLPAAGTCAKYKEALFQTNELKCEECKTNKPLYLEDDLGVDPDFICLPFSEIDNCLTYHNFHHINESSLVCIDCIEGYYINKAGFCIKRTMDETGCVVVSPTADECSKCDEGFFKDTKDGNCVKNPTGVSNCNIYRDANQCLKCQAKYYLNEGKCALVTNENKVSNCDFYLDEKTCEQCEKGYYLKENKCTKANAKNCLTYRSIDICSSCSPGEGTKEEEGIVNCVPNKDENCLKDNGSYPFKCKLCAPGYYIGDDGVCAKVKSLISKCLIYLNQETCDLCEEDYVLSANKDKCDNSFEFKPYFNRACSNLVTHRQAICHVCLGGHMFDEEGQCKKVCSDNCFFCDIENVDICLVCRSTTWMNAEGACISSEDSTDIPDTTPEHVTRLAVFSMLLLILLSSQE